MNLPLLQLGDSALPIGGYSHSWGLEAAIDRGLVRDAHSLECWVRSWLRHAVGPLEGVIVAAVGREMANENWEIVILANELLWASLTPKSLRHASRDMGEQLLALAEAWPWALDCTKRIRLMESETQCDQRLPLEWHHAPVFAALASCTGSGPRDALLVYLHQAALGAISAGVRAVPIGHTHGQQVLAHLHDDLHRLAADLQHRDLETAGSFCPAYEVLCHAQSHLYTRLFRS